MIDTVENVTILTNSTEPVPETESGICQTVYVQLAYSFACYALWQLTQPDFLPGLRAKFPKISKCFSLGVLVSLYGVAITINYVVAFYQNPGFRGMYQLLDEDEIFYGWYVDWFAYSLLMWAFQFEIFWENKLIISPRDTFTMNVTAFFMGPITLMRHVTHRMYLFWLDTNYTANSIIGLKPSAWQRIGVYSLIAFLSQLVFWLPGQIQWISTHCYLNGFMKTDLPVERLVTFNVIIAGAAIILVTWEFFKDKRGGHIVFLKVLISLLAFNNITLAAAWFMFVYGGYQHRESLQDIQRKKG